MMMSAAASASVSAAASSAAAARLSSRSSPMARGSSPRTILSPVISSTWPASGRAAGHAAPGRGDVLMMAKKKGKGGKKKGGQKKGPGSLMDLPPKAPQPKYQEGEVIMLSLSLVDSYFRKSEAKMFDGEPDITKASQMLFEAPFALLAFDETEARVCTYANGKALGLLDADWDDVVGKPMAEGPAGGDTGGCIPAMVEDGSASGYKAMGEGGSFTSSKGVAIGGVSGSSWRIQRVYGEEGDEVEEDGVGVRLDAWEKEGEGGEEADAAEEAAEAPADA